jgi:ABC-type transporter Mla MlaB component
MLRITITETPTEQRWVLQGRLTEPWIAELRSTWKRTRSARRGRTCVVDLNDVTSIDRSGERLLLAMVRKGVRCIASGVYIKHVLETLRVSRREQVARGKDDAIET